MKGYIYKLISPSNKIYIGQTVNINRRLSEYKNFHNLINQKKLFNTIKKYGWDNFIHEIIEEIEIDIDDINEFKTELNNKEIYYINFYNCIELGYNICVGGNQHRLGVKETEEQKQIKRDRWTDEKKIKQSNKWKGEANPRKGKKFGRSPIAKYVNQYDLKGNFLRTWESLSSISIENPTYSFQNISKVCNGKIKQSYGFVWRFKDDNNCNKIEVDLSRKKRVGIKGINTKKVYQYSKDNKFIKEFDSITEASKLYNIPGTNISKCCSGKRKTAGGYIWKLLME